ncbi:MAG: class D beta-lactamase [Crocinitomix sp.]|nr:class D beta-lactamase [Crocinitomix sp.]
MSINYPISIAVFLLFLVSCACESDEKNNEEAAENGTITLNLDSLYDSYEVEGSFILFDLENDRKSIYNETQIHSKFTPASTFKICNSIIALETGVVSDENFIIKWDSLERQVSSWNQDTDLSMAYTNSTVWYYQEVARQIGANDMQLWLNKLDYGNKNIGKEIDQFWLNGDLEVSPMQQINFLERILNRELDIADRTYEILDNIMTYDSTNTYEIKGKTGWGVVADKDIGWFIGWIETDKKKYIFVNCIQSTGANDQFVKARIDIVYQVFRENGIIAE